MHSLAMQGQMHAMSGATRQSQLSTGSASHQQRAFKPFKFPTCAASSAAAGIPARQGACGPTRRDMMLLGAAMLSYQASYPNVGYYYTSTTPALHFMAPFSTDFVPHAAMQMLISWLGACHTCKRRDANAYRDAQESRAAGFTGNFADFVSPSQPEPVLFPRKALDQVFAVLLMRSAYEAVDDLNFIPMVGELTSTEIEPHLICSSKGASASHHFFHCSVQRDRLTCRTDFRRPSGS